MSTLPADKREDLRRLQAWALGAGIVALLVCLIAAPFIFQMMGGENRAFQGNSMINDFKPIMTNAKVTRVQNYFPVIGPAAGQIRNPPVPLATSDRPCRPARTARASARAPAGPRAEATSSDRFSGTRGVARS